MTMSNNKVIVIEGLPGTGKTTLANKFADKGVRVIPEMFLKMDENSYRDELFFFQNDIAKVMEGRRIGGIVLVERTYPSTLAHNYSRLIIDNKPEYFNILKAFSENKLREKIVPDLYIYINIDVKTSLLRKNRPVTQNDIWTQEKYLNYIKDFYENYFQVMEPNIPLFVIDGKQSLDKIYEDIRKIISS